MPTFEQQTREMRRLYLDEEWSLREIAKRFNLSFQAVHLRLIRAGVEFRPRIQRSRRQIEKDILERMYVAEGLAIYRIAQDLKASERTIKAELKRHRIEEQKLRFPSKHSYLNSMKIGESVRIPRPPGPRKPHINLYVAAAHRGIRVSVRSIDAKTLEVTRKA